MSIKRRFLILLGLLIGGFALSVGAIRWLEEGQLDLIRAESAVERGLVLDRWLAITTRQWNALVLEYAQGKELGRLLNGDADQARTRLAASLSYFDAAAAWVLHPDGSVWLAAGAPTAAAASTILRVAPESSGPSSKSAPSPAAAPM